MSNIVKAINAVKRGPEIKRLKVNGHHWNFKKAKRDGFDRAKGTGVITGQISHNVRFADDDQVHYVITYEGLDPNGKPRKPQVEIKMNRALWGQIASKVAGSVVALISKNAKAGVATDAIAKEIFKHVHGNWEAVANGLVAVIATEFGKDLYSTRMLARARAQL